MEKIACILLAAGESKNMKEFKPLLPFGDSTIALHIVTLLKKLNIDPIIVVTGYKAKQLEKHLFFTKVQFIKNERYQCTDMFESVKLGIQNIKEDCDRVLIMPIDMPNISQETIQNEINIHTPIITTQYKGQSGHPVIIDYDVALEICQYTGSNGLRGAIENSHYPIVRLEVEDEGVLQNISTQEQYKEVIEQNFINGKGYPITASVLLRLSAHENFYGPGVNELLKKINDTGSIQEACTLMGMSYSKGRKMLKTIEQQLGYPAVTRWTGGIGGGGSVLTDEGKQLIETYETMKEELDDFARDLFVKHFGKGFKS